MLPVSYLWSRACGACACVDSDAAGSSGCASMRRPWTAITPQRINLRCAVRSTGENPQPRALPARSSSSLDDRIAAHEDLVRNSISQLRPSPANFHQEPSRISTRLRSEDRPERAVLDQVLLAGIPTWSSHTIPAGDIFPLPPSCLFPQCPLTTNGVVRRRRGNHRWCGCCGLFSASSKELLFFPA